MSCRVILTANCFLKMTIKLVQLFIKLIKYQVVLTFPNNFKLHQILCSALWICLDSFQPHEVNSLAPGRFEGNIEWVIFRIILAADGWCICCEIVLRWISIHLSGDKSTLVQVMAWCRQATSHYLSQCCPRSMSPYGVTRPQWVN